MARSRTQRGLIQDFGSRNGLAYAYRSVFGEVCRALGGRGKQLCAIASASADEGRTTAAINLAGIAARETGERVLLIDADSDRPSLHLPFGLSAGPGLAEVVRKEVPPESAIRSIESHAGVSILTSGAAPLGSVVLADGERVGTVLDELRAQFSWLFMDTAPLLSSPGAARLIARADGVVLAVRWSGTRAQIVRQATDKLESANANVLGVVLTQRHYVIPSYVYRRL